jgi:glucose-1-phosphate thymidylyltransferase
MDCACRHLLFQDGRVPARRLQYLLDNGIRTRAALTNAWKTHEEQSTVFVPGRVTEWLDCGSKDAIVFTNQRYLGTSRAGRSLVAESAKITNSFIIEPVYIGEDTIITDSVWGGRTCRWATTNQCATRACRTPLCSNPASVLNAVITQLHD